MNEVILDTDIGDDIDDALALAFAVQSRALRFLAVTTVYAEVEERARLVAHLLAAAGCPGIPVAIGLSEPLKHRPPRTGWIAAQARVLNREARFDAIIPTPAPRHIAELLERAPAPVTLAGIGPLTNIATVLTEFPYLKSRIAEIVIMGGLFTRPQPEWNMSRDPEAADITFRAGVPMRVVPLEITERCLLSGGPLARLGTDGRPLQSLLSTLVRYWQDKFRREEPVLHDPLAVGCLVCPHLYAFEACDVTVDLTPGPEYGRTTAVPNAASPVRVCRSVDYDGFLELYTSCLFGEEPPGKPGTGLATPRARARKAAPEEVL